MTDTITVDLQERVDDLDAELDRIRERAQTYDRTADGTGAVDVDDDALIDAIAAGEYATVVSDISESMATYDDLREQYEETARQKERLEDAIDAWGGSTFEIKAGGAWSDQTLANDLIRSDTQASEDIAPEAQLGAMKRRYVQVFTTSTPPDAPDDPREYPPVVGEFLYERIDAATRFGEVAPGNWRLDQALGETK